MRIVIRYRKIKIMKLYTTLFALLLSTLSIGQQSGELVIFSDDGEKFYAVLNGIYQNYEPETNVRIQDLTDEWYKCKIVSSDNIFTIDKNIAVKMNTTVTYRIIEKNGEYKLRYFTETPKNDYAGPSSGQSHVVYHSTGETPVSMQTTMTTTTSTTTTSGGINNGGESVNVNINVSENGMSTNISAYDGVSTSGTTTTYSETTTVTTTQGGSNAQANMYEACQLDNAGYERLKNSIEGESFSDDKLRVARTAAKNKCLSVQQIKGIARLFSFSDEQLEFTKAAYGNCLNRQNYYEVLEVFTFSSDKDELENYINTH